LRGKNAAAGTGITSAPKRRFAIRSPCGTAQAHDSSRFPDFVRSRFNDCFERSFNMNQILA
jgi:hypothetical protein